MSNILILQDNSRQLQQDPPPGDPPPGSGAAAGRNSLEVDRNGQKRPSEAPEGYREDICRGGGTQARKEALQSSSVIRCQDPPPGT